MLDVLSSSCLHPLLNEEEQEAAAGKYRICKAHPFCWPTNQNSHILHFHEPTWAQRGASMCGPGVCIYTQKHRNTNKYTHLFGTYRVASQQLML